MIFGKNFPHSCQLETKDCGPACLQMLCKYYGAFYELEYLREITGIKKEGISIYDYIAASEKLGLRSLAFRVSYPKFKEEVPLPCTVHWRGKHFVVVYKITKKNIYVSDPQEGLIKYTNKEFAKGWLAHTESIGKQQKGVCIVSELTSNFKTTESKRHQTNYLDTFKFIWEYMRIYKRDISKIIALMIVITLLNALLPIITQSIIDVGIPTKDQNFITLMMISSIILTISICTSSWIKQLINTHFATRIKISMQADFIGKLFNLPLSFFENRLMGDIMQRSYDYDRIETFIIGAAFNFILAIFQLIIFGGILFNYNPTIFLIFIITSVLYIIWVVVFWRIRKRMDIKYFSYLAYNQSYWVEMLSNIIDIKDYNYGINKRWQWEKVQVNLFKTKIKLLNIEQLQNTGSGLLSSFKDVLLIYIASLSVMDGNMSIGILIAIQYILGQLRMPMENIINFIVSVQLANISYMRILEIKSLSTESPNDLVNNNLIDYNQNIVLHNVYYKYSINDDFVIKNISCIIPKGKMIALVGESGCGKSTIIKLLAKLYLPTSGYMTIGNLNSTAIPIEEWRKKCATISQESTLLKESILDNILFGRPFNAEVFFEAVTIANIKAEIEKLPLSYNTMIKENGKGVSEGQKQRILFARAIYGHPEYLFLDEITSSLDPNNEQSIINTIKNNHLHTTIVMAAHRLSSVKCADYIIVIKNGTIAEMGTHMELILRHKEYYMLFKSQLNNQ